MAFPVRRCALVGRLSDPRVAESVAALLPHLSARQVQVIVGEDAPLGQTGKHVLRVAEREIGAHADLVIAIGGDGTLLYAAGLVARHGVRSEERRVGKECRDRGGAYTHKTK